MFPIGVALGGLLIFIIVRVTQVSRKAGEP